ncbi:MAG: tRNA (adenosine(37)-N6)-dimethylallyltransferase MiaA [Alphaproteobacteria bacterium]
MQEKVKIICGATASGKSAKAIELALKNNGVIINADSQQVYRELPILTACPCEQDLALVPHKLYGFIGGDERMDASKWCEFAVAEIKKVFEEGKQPYVVGGTGFYIKALTEGLSVIPSVPQKIRDLVRKEGIGAKVADLYNIVKKYDPDLASRISPNDKQRILRGIEVFRATGVPLSAWQRNKKIRPLGDMEFDIELVDFEMCELERRIKFRTSKMLESGAIDEVEALYRLGYDERAGIYKVLGVKEIKDYLDGKMTMSDLKDKIILITRQYAKRQRTFFKTQINALKNN